ncbi:replication protein, partial [Priestia megaterium]
HEANHKGKPLSLDNMCQLLYKIAKNQFYQLVNPKNEDYSSVYPTHEEVIHKEESSTKLFIPKHIIRKEILPDWLKAEQDQEKGTKKVEISLEQQL